MTTKKRRDTDAGIMDELEYFIILVCVCCMVSWDLSLLLCSFWKMEEVGLRMEKYSISADASVSNLNVRSKF